MLIYFCVSGLLTFFIFYTGVRDDKTGKTNELINNFDDHLTFEESKLVISIMCLLLGFMLLPLVIFNRLKKFFVK